MSFFLNRKIDFAAHNAEVKQLWEDFACNRHSRIPVMCQGSIRNLLSNPAVNQTGYHFSDFFSDPRAQVVCQVAHADYLRHHWWCDHQMGVPEEAWDVRLDFQNSYDQGWFGCPLFFMDPDDLPDTLETLKETPEALYDWGPPDPFWGRGDVMRRAMELYEGMKQVVNSGYEYKGKPVRLATSLFAGSDGIFSVALKMRGTVECMCDMYENPDYFHALMNYITEGTIARLKAHRAWARLQPENLHPEADVGQFYYADDSIAMLSTEQFQEFVMPYQERLYREFSDNSFNWLHLCGDATHHFPFLAEHFHISCFDTGFPVDHGKLRRQLGPKITIQGGPTIMLMKDGTPEAVRAETKRILTSGVLDGGRFVLREANNMAPGTPVENIAALYEAGKEFGRLR